jgi:dTDP-4-dehydrorhamnose 3,5-epimerase-like enzyme
MNSHTDERRTLVEFGNGTDWKLCKVIKTHKDCVLGNHYHEEKIESFMLVSGGGTIKINGFMTEDMELFKEYFISENIMHEFNLTKDSILIGLCNKEFDLQDEHR